MVKKNRQKYKILESLVVQSGNQYQDAASVLANSDGNHWVACINASLAIEIYLKSFLITKHQVQGYSRFMGTVHKSHDLAKLYKKLHPHKKLELLEAIEHVSPGMDLVAELTRYRNVFTNARYTFEPNNIESMGSGIINLARVLRLAVTHILKVRYPVNSPRTLKKWYSKHLGKSKHNKAFKRDSQRVAFLLCVGFCGYGVMRKVGSSVGCPLTRRYVQVESCRRDTLWINGQKR